MQTNTVLQESKNLKSLAASSRDKTEAVKGKDGQMTKRKELEVAGFSPAPEIDEQLPIPQKDDEEPSKKRLQRLDENEEET
jgi:hypothetical protein